MDVVVVTSITLTVTVTHIYAIIKKDYITLHSLLQFTIFF